MFRCLGFRIFTVFWMLIPTKLPWIIKHIDFDMFLWAIEFRGFMPALGFRLVGFRIEGFGVYGSGLQARGL